MAEENKTPDGSEIISKAIYDLGKTLDQRLERIEEIVKGQYEELWKLSNILEQTHMSPATDTEAGQENQTENRDSQEERLMTQFGSDMDEYMQLYDELDREMQEKGKKGAEEIGSSVMSFEEWLTNGKPASLLIEDPFS